MTQRQPRQLVASGSPYEEPIGFSRAVRVGDRVVVAGTAPNWPDGHVDPDPEVQADRCIEIMLTALREAGASPDDVIRTRTYLVDAADWQAAGRAHGRVFRRARPASTMVVVSGFLDPRWRVEMEAEAIVGAGSPGGAGVAGDRVSR
ncbi:MAG: RidA family protein [Chloroflexota bacterium]|jgi:enamine deaminase RidA (YjgF/YER057c/UK114 family)